MRTTYMARPLEVERKWYVVDAAGKTLGRLSTEVATLLRGKHKSMYTPHVDTGDFVIVINASQVALTGKKMAQKIYYRHSGYPGGLRAISAGKLHANRPERMI
jgi:large subunit ribosomal protein L13